MAVSAETEKNIAGTAYVTVYHTVNVHVGLGILSVPCMAIVAAVALWRLCP